MDPGRSPASQSPKFDRTRACAYGDRYGQLAVYELTADEVHVVRCDDAEIVRARDNVRDRPPRRPADNMMCRRPNP